MLKFLHGPTMKWMGVVDRTYVAPYYIQQWAQIVIVIILQQMRSYIYQAFIESFDKSTCLWFECFHSVHMYNAYSMALVTVYIKLTSEE